MLCPDENQVGEREIEVVNMGSVWCMIRFPDFFLRANANN